MISARVPAWGARTSIVTLSVSICAMTSSSCTASPADFEMVAMVPAPDVIPSQANVAQVKWLFYGGIFSYGHTSTLPQYLLQQATNGHCCGHKGATRHRLMLWASRPSSGCNRTCHPCLYCLAWATSSRDGTMCMSAWTTWQGYAAGSIASHEYGRSACNCWRVI